jgi:hypothetical protein
MWRSVSSTSIPKPMANLIGSQQFSSRTILVVCWSNVIYFSIELTLKPFNSNCICLDLLPSQSVASAFSFHVSSSLFHSFGHTKGSPKFRSNLVVFTAKECWPTLQLTARCRLSVTAYSTFSQPLTVSRGHLLLQQPGKLLSHASENDLINIDILFWTFEIVQDTGQYWVMWTRWTMFWLPIRGEFILIRGFPSFVQLYHYWSFKFKY